MKRMLLGTLMALAAAGAAGALPVTITFEGAGVPFAVGSFYAGSGVIFDANWGVITATATYPAHSGSSIVYSAAALARVNFTEPVWYVEAWFTSTSNAQPSLYMEAYSGPWGTGTLLGVATIERNARSMDAMLVESFSGDIMSVVIHDAGNMFTMDDLSFEPVPEPATFLLVFGGLGLTALRKRRQ
ncbi:MAG TPA: PEP-CTERM sorting domain-containing protein [Planctomycetota bacterium]|nr:PEP-CTERM sorting domain-containing protein [Planctomycetota bacterium]